MEITTENIEIFARLCEAFSVMVGAYVVIRGISAWREEMIGRRKAELAEEVLCLFYEIKDIFISSRFPGSFSNEGVTRKVPDGKVESEDETAYKNSLYVAVERLFKNNETFSKVQAIRYRFIAYFGKDASKPFDEIKNAHSRIVVSTRMLIETYGRREENRPDLVKQRQRWESDIGWWADESEDQITPLIDGAVQSIENLCQPCLAAKRT